MDAYKIFSSEEAAAYVRQALPEFSKKGPLRARRLAGDSRSVDGHVNEITRVEAADGSSVILKQLMPHVNLTSHGEVYELPLARMAVEVHALRFWERLCPGKTPQIYRWDDAQKLLVMEDLGRLLSSLVLSYAALQARNDVAAAEKREHQAYLLDVIEEIYQEFGDSFQTAWEEHFGESNPFQSPYNRFSRQERLVDTLGFIACASVGRLCDAGLPFDFKELTDPQVRAAGQRLVLRLAEELLLCGKKMTEINELTACLRRLVQA